MNNAYILTPELRRRLKQPLGLLIRGPFNDTVVRLGEILRKKKPTLIVSVGDSVTATLIERKILPDVSITDDLCMRKRLSSQVPFTDEKIVRVHNPQATITDEAIVAVKNAFVTTERTRIMVQGEEDLLTLAAVLFAPLNSLVLYGQPQEGLVVIDVTPEKKAEIASILRDMGMAGKTK